jgi:nucleoside-diphosphate-sugar epimerase
MNLVCVENVVAALVFMLDSQNIDREVFIISDDEVIINNYRDIEDQILAICGKSYCVPRVSMPKFILTALLKIMGRLSIAPYAKFSDKKLSDLGFIKPQKFDQALFTFSEKCYFLASSRVK